MLNKINFLTAGESHGKGLIGIIDGIPAGLTIQSKYIDFHLSRRQKGFGMKGRMKIEKDQVEILAGYDMIQPFGSPIGLIIKNIDYKNWIDIMSVEKKSKKLKKLHYQDLVMQILLESKYQFNDIRNVIERSSARETTK